MVNPDRPVKITSIKPVEPSGLLRRLETAARAAGFSIETFGRADAWPLQAFIRDSAPPGRPTLYLSAGIHGDEPAGPLALAELLEAGFFDHRANWEICPLLNPVGLALGLREDRAGFDLNRQYRAPTQAETKAHIAWLRTRGRYAMTLCLHEDWESVGFYLYEVKASDTPALAETMVDAARRVGPVDETDVIDGRPALGGIIRPELQPNERPLWAEAVYLIVNHTPRSYTLETPSALDLGLRVRMQIAATEAGINALLSEYPPPA